MKLKKLFALAILLLCFCTGTELYAQTLSIKVMVSPQPSPYFSVWKTRQETVILTVTNTGSTDVLGKIRAVVSKDGERVAQTNDNRMPMQTFTRLMSSVYHADQIIPFGAVDFYGDAKNSSVKTSMLPSGSYQICVTLLNRQNVPILEKEVCASFFLTDYQAPVLLSPPDRTVLAQQERPTFRWTPVTPAPLEAVRYKVQVFEVLQGQRTMQAFRVNRPILDKEVVGVNQLIWPPEYQLPGRVNAYVWTVRALDSQGNGLGAPDGYAEPLSFTVGGNRISARNDEDTPDPEVLGADGTGSVFTQDGGFKRPPAQDTTQIPDPDTILIEPFAPIDTSTHDERGALIIKNLVPSKDTDRELKESKQQDKNPPTCYWFSGPQTGCVNNIVPLTTYVTGAHTNSSCTNPPQWYCNSIPIGTPAYTLSFLPTVAGIYKFQAKCSIHNCISWNYPVHIYSVTPTVNIIPQPGIIASSTGAQVPCSLPFTLTGNATGGQPPYAYSWSVYPPTNYLNPPTSNSQTYTTRCKNCTTCVLAGSTITLRATDANGCTATKKYKIRCKP